MQVFTRITKSKLYKKELCFGLAIIIIIIFGFLLRYKNLASQSYWMDEGYTINAVLSIRDNNSLVLDSGERYNCQTYCYPTYWISTIFGENAFSYRLFSVLAGILLIPLVYFLIKKVINRKVAFLSSFFLALSYFEIAWSRQARWYTLFSLLFFCAIYFIYKAVETKKWQYHALSVGTILLAIFTHSLGILLPFIYLIYLLVDSYKKNKRFFIFIQ